MKIKYPAAIETGDENTAYSVIVPDLPGCFSAGDTLEEAMENVQEAISLWIETVLDDGGKIPAPGSLSDHTKNPDYQGWTWVLIDIDSFLLDDSTERVNISVPKRILARIDKYASDKGETRSGFLVGSAMEKIMGTL